MRRRCKAGELAATNRLPATDKALLRGWLDTGTDTRGRRVAASAMAQALSAEGHRVSATTLKDHRGSRCVCD